MANDASNVFVAKPKSGGAVFVAPKGTTPPTDATTALASAFECLGFISEDGAEQENSDDVQDFKAWGGDKVLSVNTSHEERQKMTFIEQNVEVLKQVYGADNVSGTWQSGITVSHNAKDKDEYVYVIETVLGKTNINRLVIPRGKVIEIGNVVRKDDQLFGYETTIDCLADNNGNNAYEYFAKVESTGTTGATS